MAKRAKPVEIIAKLRWVEVLLCRRETTGQQVCDTGVKGQA